MRYDTPIYLQTVTAGKYDAVSGNYEPDAVEEIKVYADVTSAGVETLRLVYGELKQGSYTVRLQNHISKPFDSIRIGSGDAAKIYRVDFRRKLRRCETMVISEVQGNAVTQNNRA